MNPHLESITTNTATLTEPQEAPKWQNVATITKQQDYFEVQSVSAMTQDVESKETNLQPLSIERKIEIYKATCERRAIRRCEEYARYVDLLTQAEEADQALTSNNIFVEPINLSPNALPGLHYSGITYPSIEDIPMRVPINESFNLIFFPPSQRLINFLQQHHPLDQVAILSKFAYPSRLPAYIEWLGNLQFASHLPYPSAERYSIFRKEPTTPVSRPHRPRSLPEPPSARIDDRPLTAITSRRFIRDKVQKTETFVLKVTKCLRFKKNSVERVVLKSFVANSSICGSELTMARKKGCPALALENGNLLEVAVQRFKQETATFVEQMSDEARANLPDVRGQHYQKNEHMRF